MRIDPASITAKCVEVSKCFLDKKAGLYSYELDGTRKVGNIARLAANMRQSGILEIKQLAAIGTAIKQDFSTIRSDMIPALEQLNWIEVDREGNKIKKIYEAIPPLEDILPILGTYWEEEEPNNIDLATIESLYLLKNKPFKKESLISELEIPETEFKTALNYGTQVNYFGTFKSFESEEEIIWTPYYWTRNITDTLKFLKKQPDEFNQIENLTKEILKYPGKPLNSVNGDMNTLKTGVKYGFFPSVGIKDANGENHNYVFPASPQFGLDPKEDIFEKARLIVACVRHGQHDADVSRILYPLNLLEKLRKNEMKPHSYALTQYALLITNRICEYEIVDMPYGKSYKIKFINSPENEKAMDLAEDILKREEPFAGIMDEPEVDNLLTEGMFNYSAEQRQIITAEEIAAKEEFERMLENIRGSY